MHDDIAIKVHNLHKSFDMAENKGTSIKQLLVNAGKKNKKHRQKVLDGIDFEVKKGEFFGIIGRNGNGKSTLLKLLAGVYTPDKGAVAVNGQLTPFIELGVGFNPELTGRDNVYLSASLLGLNRSEVDNVYDDIVSFAELEDHMDKKLKNYSSGMQVRLAFSIAIRSDSDILLIDEVLAVGDSNFQKKCIEVFRELKDQGKTIVFVSHSMGYIKDFCDRVAVISDGEVLFIGDTEKGVDVYNKLNFDEESEKSEADNKKLSNTIERLGNGNATISDWSFYNDMGKKSIKLASGQKFSVELTVNFNNTVTNPAIGVMFRKNQHDNLFGINNYYQKKHFGLKHNGDELKIRVEGKLPLAPGTYFVTFSVVDAKTSSDYVDLDTLNNVTKVNVDGADCWGLIKSDAIMELQT